MTGEIPELASNQKFGKFGQGQSYGLYGEAFPGMGSRSGPGAFFGGHKRGYQEVIPGGVKDIKDTNGLRGLKEQTQTSQLGNIGSLKGTRDLEGVGRLSETKQTRSIGEYGGYAFNGKGKGYGNPRADSAYAFGGPRGSRYGPKAAPYGQSLQSGYGKGFGQFGPRGGQGKAHGRYGAPKIGSPRFGGYAAKAGPRSRSGYGGPSRPGPSYGKRP